MTKVIKTRIHSKAKIDPTKTDPNQRYITEFYKPPDFSKIRMSSNQKSLFEYFKTKNFQISADPIDFLVKYKQVPLIKDYGKKLYLAQAKEYREQLKKNSALPEKRKYWKGYMFYATNNNSEYTVVTMIPKADKNKIYPAGTKVATATVDEDSALTFIEVKTPFRKQKIGSQLIRFISKCKKNFMVYSGTEHNSRYRLTEEGAKLIKYCEKKGILDSEQVVIGNPQSPSSWPF